jgi:CDP-diacylglycerol---glycerol-3-phosphate 3-phosphatidyltransferase
MTLPDKLTLSRIFLTFVFMLFLFISGILAKIIALLIFLVASFTDFLDGYIAKGRNISTNFGKLMDPIADKILVIASFLAFVQLGLIQAWMVVIIILREIAITGLRAFAAMKGRVIASDGGGKHKMVSQVVTIFVILLFLIFREGGSARFGFWTDGAQTYYSKGILVLMYITVALTLISGVSCFLKNKEVFSNASR